MKFFFLFVDVVIVKEKIERKIPLKNFSLFFFQERRDRVYKEIFYLQKIKLSKTKN